MTVEMGMSGRVSRYARDGGQKGFIAPVEAKLGTFKSPLTLHNEGPGGCHKTGELHIVIRLLSSRFAFYHPCSLCLGLDFDSSWVLPAVHLTPEFGNSSIVVQNS